MGPDTETDGERLRLEDRDAVGYRRVGCDCGGIGPHIWAPSLLLPLPPPLSQAAGRQVCHFSPSSPAGTKPGPSPPPSAEVIAKLPDWVLTDPSRWAGRMPLPVQLPAVSWEGGGAVQSAHGGGAVVIASSTQNSAMSRDYWDPCPSQLVVRVALAAATSPDTGRQWWAGPVELRGGSGPQRSGYGGVGDGGGCGGGGRSCGGSEGVRFSWPALDSVPNPTIAEPWLYDKAPCASGSAAANLAFLNPFLNPRMALLPHFSLQQSVYSGSGAPDLACTGPGWARFGGAPGGLALLTPTPYSAAANVQAGLLHCPQDSGIWPGSLLVGDHRL